MNLDLTNPENRRVFFLGVGGIVVAIIFIAGIFTFFSEDEVPPSEDGVTNYLDAPVEAQDAVRSFPVTIEDIQINYSYTNQVFTVDYPGYYEIADIENKVLSYLYANTELKEVKVCYGGIKGVEKTYSLDLEQQENPEDLDFH